MRSKKLGNQHQRVNIDGMEPQDHFKPDEQFELWMKDYEELASDMEEFSLPMDHSRLLMQPSAQAFLVHDSAAYGEVRSKHFTARSKGFSDMVQTG